MNPAPSERPVTHQGTDVPRSPVPRPSLVLVVDDNGVSRLLLSHQVTDLGHRAATATTGRQALEQLRAQHVDLVLLDIDMPEMDGHAVLREMKADPALREVPVIMVSGMDDFDSVVHCIAHGAEDYLPKPFNPILLRARIGACLEKKRLTDAERLKTEELERTLRQLRATQAQLVVQEKLASLGTLTAGIAHEIKNPLNFVTNFAQLSVGLVAELREELAAGPPKPDAPARATPTLAGASGWCSGSCGPEGEPSSLRPEVEELLDLLAQNVTKIREHGQRADSIIAGMLLHARGGKGEWQTVDLNALVDQAVQLAYHGLRVQDPSTQITLQTDYDPDVGQVRVVPQDLSRVFLNIASNACQALQEKRSRRVDFVPTLAIRTRVLPENTQDRVEVRLRDNGDGVPPAIRDKIFQPFFTTKPAGQGTGLGLSISYDVVRVHQGELRLETEPGRYAEFIITLPRQGGTPARSASEGEPSPSLALRAGVQGGLEKPASPSPEQSKNSN